MDLWNQKIKPTSQDMFRNKFSKIFVLIFFLPFSLMAESGNDFLRNIGKIYSVVAVIAIVFIGIICCLILLERRISKLEKSKSNEFKTG